MDPNTGEIFAMRDDVARRVGLGERVAPAMQELLDERKEELARSRHAHPREVATLEDEVRAREAELREAIAHSGVAVSGEVAQKVKLGGREQARRQKRRKAAKQARKRQR